MRLPKPPKDFIPDGWKPTHLDFEPDDFDKKAATDRNTNVRVSVWDMALTAPVQARVMRQRACLVLTSHVHLVLSRGSTAVVYDRVDDVDVGAPGAEGHAGIEGMERRKSEARPLWRGRLQGVAECFVLEGTL